MDPREVEMVAIVNMQNITYDQKKEVEELENAAKRIEHLQIIDNAKKEVDPEILQPGTKIRPEATAEDARKLAERLYGIVCSEISELISYDDRNFLIQADRNIKNPIIPNNCPHGYVLKIQNSLDSSKIDFAEAQTQLLLFLGQQNIQCPKPVMNIFGKNFSVSRIGQTKHIVRLLEFQPGNMFHSVPKCDNLFYQAGEFVARLDNAIKHFEHEAFKTHRTLWQLQSLGQLSDFVYALKDEEKRGMVEQVIETFDEKVMKKIDTFASGIIHGDFNEQNILVNKPDGSDVFKVSGVIDFGDTSLSPYVFELAITMAYMIVQSGEISTGGLIMAGYSMARLITPEEKEILKVCVAARLCQSLVMGAYTHSLDPENNYVLTTQSVGWGLLSAIWSEPDDKLLELWTTTADTYLTKSTK